MSDQIWMPLAGFGDRYEISDNGAIRLSDGTVISQRPDKDGYLIATLWDGTEFYTVKPHRLVLMTFVGAPSPETPDADHIDRDRRNNALSNLRWVSHALNLRLRSCYGRSGIKGVRQRTGRANSWQAYVNENGRFKHIGHFSTCEKAAAAVAGRYL